MFHFRRDVTSFPIPASSGVASIPNASSTTERGTRIHLITVAEFATQTPSATRQRLRVYVRLVTLAMARRVLLILTSALT